MRCAGVDTLYNERPYDARGWCTFESAVSSELLVRLRANPRTVDILHELDALPPKLLQLRSGEPSRAVDLDEEVLNGRATRIVAKIQGATFTGKGDKVTVPSLYRTYATEIAAALHRTLAQRQPRSHAEPLAHPQMPIIATHAAVRAWHLDCLRVDHEWIEDALSGRRLETLTDCVKIGVGGQDAAKTPLASVHEAAGLSGWLPQLLDGSMTGALLLAGAAAGKSWLMSQVIMHSLGGRLVPILVKVAQLASHLAKNEKALDAADNWIDAYLQLTCAHDAHHTMLRQAMRDREALLLIDGLDEAGELRARLEAHIAQDLVHTQRQVVLCTSRPAGLSEVFAPFHQLRLEPLTTAQQEAFLEHRLTPERATELRPYLRDRVPFDVETQQRVTGNPLMLAMVVSIAEIYVGIEMPATTAELYEVAAGAILSREAEVSDAMEGLMRAVFFEAHAAKTRIITADHLAAAATRLVAPRDLVDALVALVMQDRLPLVRLLQA